MTIRCRWSMLSWLAWSLLVTTSTAAEPIALTTDSIVAFATREEGRAALLTPDRYTQSLSRFDMESRLFTNNDVTLEQFMHHAADQVVDWSDADRAKLERIIASAAKRLVGLDLPFPPTILLIQTTGLEEGDAAYCRRHAMILPRRYAGFAEPQLERLFLHELFHILSSHNEPLRHRLYEIVGFRPCPEIKLPTELADLKITNPDGPTLNYYIELEVEGQRQLAIPLLHASERFDPAQRRTFFKYMKFSLLAIEQHEDRWLASQVDDAPVLLDPKQLPAFQQKIGRNTSYIIHPDEILADNFVHLVMRSPDLPTPEIITAMEKVLRSPDDAR